MTMPPPPPDRMHLQYQPPPQQPPLPGPGGAYGPMQPYPQQPQAAGGMIQPGPAGPPQRPESRPGAVGVAAVAVGLLAAVAAWQIWLFVRDIMNYLEWARENGSASPGSYSFADELFSGVFPQPGVWIIAYAVLLLCAVITIPALLKGAVFGRVFGLVWSIAAVLVGGYALYTTIDAYNRYFAGSGLPLFSGPNSFGWYLIADIAFTAAALTVFILSLTPGVRAWTPSKPAPPPGMTAPMGQQPGQYGGHQHGHPPQQPYGGPGQPPQQQQPYGRY